MRAGIIGIGKRFHAGADSIGRFERVLGATVGCFQQLRKDFLISFRTNWFRWKTRMRLAAVARAAKSVDLNSVSHDFRKPIGGLSAKAQRSQISRLKRSSGR